MYILETVDFLECCQNKVAAPSKVLVGFLLCVVVVVIVVSVLCVCIFWGKREKMEEEFLLFLGLSFSSRILLCI